MSTEKKSRIILIKPENAEIIKTAIDEAEGKAKARTITADNVISACENITRLLRIPKTSMEGIVANVDINSQTFSNSYKYPPESTQFTAVYKRGEWRLVSVRRGYCVRRDKTNAELTLTPEAEKAILNANRLMRV